MTDTAPPPAQTSVTAHPGIDSLNSPDVVGVMPGSIRVMEDTRIVSGRLNRSTTFNFSMSALALEGALVGSETCLVMSCKAKKDNGTDVLLADAITLQEEASNILWRDITLKVNGKSISKHTRADVIRHSVDRLHGSDRQLGSTQDRQLSNDSSLLAPVAVLTTDPFYDSMIHDGQRFELIRPLDDLPLFARGDSLVPGFNTISIRAVTTPDPQSLFKTDGTITESPYLEVEQVSLRYSMVLLEPVVARELQTLSASGKLELTGDLWSATELTPRIDPGAKNWNQGVSTAFNTAPDVAYFMAFPQSSFIPPANSFSSSLHPLTHTWSAMSEFRFTDGNGQDLRDYKNIDGIGGKVQLIKEMRKAVAHAGGMNDGTGSLANSSGVQPETFVLEPGMGVVPLVMRNWAEKNTHLTKPMSIRIQAQLNDPISAGAAEAAQPFLVSKSRHRWVLSTTPGETRIVL